MIRSPFLKVSMNADFVQDKQPYEDLNLDRDIQLPYRFGRVIHRDDWIPRQ